MDRIKNCPNYAKDYEFVVVRKVDDEYWFYGAYADGFKAEQVCLEIGGVIFHNVRIQGKRKKQLTNTLKYDIINLSKEREVKIMMITMFNVCPFCGCERTVEVDALDLEKYESGELAQIAFPSPKYSVEIREFIISGICPECQESIFGGSDDE